MEISSRLSPYHVSILEGDIDIRQTYVGAEESPVDYHRDALAYWLGKRRGRWAPRWTDVSLMDFPAAVIPLISVTDIAPEPLSSVYRFWGTQLTEIHGGDYSGKSPHLVPPVSLGIANTGGCGRLVNERVPHLEVKEFRTDRGRIGRALVLRLPLSDDGVDVNHGLNIYYFEPAQADQRQAPFFSKIFEKLSA